MAPLDSDAPWAVAEWDAGGRVAARYGGDAEPSTRFMIGSITKTVTGRLLAEAVVDGVLGLDEPLPGPTFFGRAITPAHLASHLSGLPRLPVTLQPISAQPYAPWDEARVAEAFRRARIWRAPGARYAYSNFGYAALGLTVARRQPAAYEELALNLLRRMGAEAADFGVADPGLDAAGNPTEPWRMAAFAPAGGLTMTLPALVAYGRAVQREDSEAARRVRTWHLAASSWFRLSRRPSPVAGFGWHFAPDGSLFHDGKVAGYQSSLRLFPGGEGRAVLTASWRSKPELVTLAAA